MKKPLLLSASLTLVFSLVFTACEKEELEPDINKVDYQQNSEATISETNIPDSALALLEQLAQQQTLENGDNPSADFSTARIGDRTSRGTVSTVSGYPNRLRITGIRIGELCPNKLVRGDREFEGGPMIYSRVTLKPYGNQLWAWVTFQARETKGDYSTVTLGTSGQWVFLRAIDCRNITQINSSTYSYVSYRGGNSGPDFFGCGDGSIENHSATWGLLVKKFNIIGDTGGPDISHDNDCGCDTKIYTIELNPITITIAH